MVHRLVFIDQSRENLNKESNIIEKIASNNGYNIELIDKILKKTSL